MVGDLSGILESPEPKRLATRLVGTEGPLWHPAGYVTFVARRRSELLRWDTSGQVTLVRENTGEGNGCTLDRKGRLVMCEGADHRRITAMGADGTIVTLADRWQGKRINKPNDVVLRRRDGSLYFTDPNLRLAVREQEMDFSGVFRIAPHGQLQLMTRELAFPNGIAFSPDESVLYVANSLLDERCFDKQENNQVCSHRYIRAFDLAKDGGLKDSRLFADMASSEKGVPDGIKADVEGRVFCCGSGGIWVLEPTGRRLGIIRLPEVPRNLAFGDPDHRTMFITTGESLYSLRVKTPGIGADSPVD